MPESSTIQNKGEGAGLRRFFLWISYNGANYGGWQRQANAPSVQQTLEDVCRLVLRQPVVVLGSSRTDAGVHAVGQVAQMDFEPFDSLENHRFRLNMALPSDISVDAMAEVPPSAQCRFDARYRHYEYRISRRKNPFNLGRFHVWYRPLDMEALHACAALITSHSDFQAFSKVKTHVRNFECRIMEAGWREENGLLVFSIRANRFLRGMVRGLVGTQIEIAKGQRPLSGFTAILEGKDRRSAGENAPACGLYLTRVGYPQYGFP